MRVEKLLQYHFKGKEVYFRNESVKKVIYAVH